ncbi:hypothetical protein OAG21_03865 [Akkermansiaceae bacterium]|nr:hypothetical protein [Akkermansiaceae bacterium]
MAITSVDIIIEQIGRLKKWQEDNGASDKWYITVYGRVIHKPMPLANVESFLKSGSSAISALHADQAGDTDPQWIELINQHEADFIKNTNLKREEEALKRSEEVSSSSGFSAPNWLRYLLGDIKKAGVFIYITLGVLVCGGFLIFKIRDVGKVALEKGESVVQNLNKTPPAQPSFRKDQIIRVKEVTSGGGLGFIGGRKGRPRPFTTLRKTRYEVTYIDDDGIERTVTRSNAPTR